MEKHVHDMVTWGGQSHRHGKKEKNCVCSEMHGYCMDPLCRFVLNHGDDRSMDVE